MRRYNRGMKGFIGYWSYLHARPVGEYGVVCPMCNSYGTPEDMETETTCRYCTHGAYHYYAYVPESEINEEWGYSYKDVRDIDRLGVGQGDEWGDDKHFLRRVF